MRITHDMPTRVTKHHKRIGETKLMRCGLTATITEYYHRHDITVKVSDGSVLYKRTYTDFCRGSIDPAKTRLKA